MGAAYQKIIQESTAELTPLLYDPFMTLETVEVMCRRWNWRNGYHTRITEETQTMVMNIDGLGEDIESHTLAMRDRVARMLEEFCAAETETALLTPTQSFHRLENS